MKLIWIYLILINMAGFLVMGEDKRRAVRHLWRIPERTLFALALFGGSIGTWTGMYVFRHKTRHWYFVVGMPAILFFQILFLSRLLFSAA